MSALTLSQAQTIVTTALAHARGQKFQPLAVLVLDARGVPKAFAAEDGTSLRRYEIAHGKAHGALAMGIGSRTLGKRAEERPHFIAAVGVSGDNSDNDEAAALAGIAAAGLAADPG